MQSLLLYLVHFQARPIQPINQRSRLMLMQITNSTVTSAFSGRALLLDLIRQAKTL